MIEEKDKVIKLSDIISLVEKFQKKEISDAEMASYGENMKVRGYLPIVEKMGVMTMIAIRYLYSTEELQEIKIANIYKDLFFGAILEKYAFIDCSELELQTFENYDKLFPVFAPFILSYCQKDYDILEKMVRDNIIGQCGEGFVEVVSGIDEEVLKQSTKDNQRMLLELNDNKDLIRDLKDIAAMNNPMVANIVEELKKVNKEMNKEGFKKENINKIVNINKTDKEDNK